MTQLKAQTVISALIAAGYSVRARIVGSEWIVEANGNDINVVEVTNFANAQGVTGFISEAQFR